MTELKTKPTDKNINGFINEIENKVRQKDAKVLLDIFSKLTNQSPVIWGTRMIGYGKYHYESSRSASQGDWPLIGFSPNKANLSIHIMDGLKNYDKLLNKLGKHKTSVSCLYINKLDDVDLKILEKIILISYKKMQKIYKNNE